MTETTQPELEPTQPEIPGPSQTEAAGATSGIHRPAAKSSIFLETGDLVADRYRIEKPLGEGGMGAVYRAHDVELEETVAIKVLKPTGGDEENMLARFKQEVRLARRIRHINVCSIYDYGSWGSLKFVTMELIAGRTLEDLMKSPEETDLETRLALFRGMLAGLGAAHELGIVHRDLKPQNVMITDDGRPVIMDFGIARDLSSREMTGTGELFGTPVYMSPEHLLGQQADHRTDIYSMGVILFELATGGRPFSGNTVFEIARDQIGKQPPRPTEIRPDLAPWLERVILKMLAKKPEDRFQSIEELLSKLDDSGREARVGTVLVVDDDPEFRTLVETHLKQAGFAVLTASSGAEGIQMMLREVPDLLCLDYFMPEMDGFFVANYLRQLAPTRRTPIFMATGIQDPQYEKQANRIGIDKFFVKPLDMQSFVASVKAELAAAAG